MRKKVMAKVILTVLILAMSVTVLTGCRFGFASDPDDPNEAEKKVPIDTSTDTFEYDASLDGTSITLLNTKAEIQVALEEMGAEFEKKSGVHVEVMPVTDGDSPYTKMISLYNSGNPPTLAILDTTDVIALAEEKAVDLTGEAWTAEAEGYTTDIHGKIYSFPLCIEGRGIIYNKKAIEETLGREFDPDSVTTLDEFKALLDELVAGGMEKPVSMAKEDWSLGAHQLQYIYETFDGTSEGAQKVIGDIKAGEADLHSYTRVSEFLDMFDILKESMIIPFQAIMIPLVSIYGGTLNVLNHRITLIFMHTGFSMAMSVFMFHGFIKGNVPMALEEAAYIDGCTHAQTFFKIVLPLLKPIISTMVILNSLAFWNDFLLPSLVLTDKKLLTLPLSTYSFYGTYSADYGTIMAGLLLCVLPILVLYVVLQKQIIGGVVAGAVK